MSRWRYTIAPQFSLKYVFIKESVVFVGAPFLARKFHLAYDDVYLLALLQVSSRRAKRYLVGSLLFLIHTVCTWEFPTAPGCLNTFKGTHLLIAFLHVYIHPDVYYIGKRIIISEDHLYICEKRVMWHLDFQPAIISTGLHSFLVIGGSLTATFFFLKKRTQLNIQPVISRLKNGRSSEMELT